MSEDRSSFNHTKAEWLSILGSLLVVVIILIYFGWRILITQEWLREHREYILARDIKWDARDREIMENQGKIIEFEKMILDHVRAGSLK